jgi:hypothetical protein
LWGSGVRNLGLENKRLGAEGGLIRNTLFLPFLLGILIFLQKLQILYSAPSAPSALSAPSCTLVVPNFGRFTNS